MTSHFEGAVSVGGERWYACWTRGRAEKKVHRFLTGLDVETFLPLVEEKRRWSDRLRVVQTPLFPGYLFARFPVGRLLEVLQVPGVAAIVSVNHRPVWIPDSEIQSVRALVVGASRTGIVPDAYNKLVRGSLVEVVEGPFRGMRGTLIEIKKRSRVVVQLPAIRHAVSVELEGAVLRLFR